VDRLAGDGSWGVKGSGAVAVAMPHLDAIPGQTVFSPTAAWILSTSRTLGYW